MHGATMRIRNAAGLYPWPVELSLPMWQLERVKICGGSRRRHCLHLQGKCCMRSGSSQFYLFVLEDRKGKGGVQTTEGAKKCLPWPTLLTLAECRGSHHNGFYTAEILNKQKHEDIL